MGTERYAFEKFTQAVYALATGPGDVRSRLRVAFSYFNTVKPEYLPPELRDDFRWVIDTMTRREPRYKGEGRLQASLATMQNRTGAKIAKRIVEIQDRLREIISST